MPRRPLSPILRDRLIPALFTALLALPVSRAVADAPAPSQTPPPAAGTSPAPAQDTTSSTQGTAAPTPAAPAPAPPGDTAPAAGPTSTGRILGRVTDTGRPVQGAQVRLLSRSQSGLLRVTSSDQRGEYRFKELPTGTYDVEVEADGYRLGSKPGVEVRGPFQNIVDVPMQRGGTAPPAPPPVAGVPGQGIPGGPAPSAEPAEPPVTVHGLLVDAERRPVVDVSVLLVPLKGAKLYQAMSGNDGGFAVDGVVPGRYRVVVRSPGHMPVDLKSVEVAPQAGLTLNLSLVDFPLNFKRVEGSPPPETPRRLPGAPAPAAAAPGDPTGPATSPPPAPPPPTSPIEGSKPAGPKPPGP